MDRPEPGTIALYGDIACPWTYLANHRLVKWRSQLGLDNRVRFDMRAFALEVRNGRPTPRRTLEAETPVVGSLAPEAGWQVWQRETHEWPVTTLLALEAVEAAREQGPDAHERIAFALRRALFGASRCISMRHVVLDVAAEAGLDRHALAAALDDGRARAATMRWIDDHTDGPVKGSPHLFFADGTDAHNPGIRMHWEGEEGVGFPVVDADDESVYEDLLKRATA